MKYETIHQRKTSFNASSGNDGGDECIENEEPIENDPLEDGCDEHENTSKKVRICTSEVWKFFTKIGVKDYKEKAKCNVCRKEYVIGGSKIGTSTLIHHLKKGAVLLLKIKMWVV